MAVMAERNKAYKLKGAVQITTPILAGKDGGRPDGAVGKIPFLAAVETHDGKPAFIKLRPVPAFTNNGVKKRSSHHPKSSGLAVFLMALARGLALIGWHPCGIQKSPLLLTT